VIMKESFIFLALELEPRASLIHAKHMLYH
jgi:hypothetical protein